VSILYLSESHHFKIKLGLGQGSNNYVELMSLKLILHFANERGEINPDFWGLHDSYQLGQKISEMSQPTTPPYIRICLQGAKHGGIFTI
jgi:hypothetical protein